MKSFKAFLIEQSTRDSSEKNALAAFVPDLMSKKLDKEVVEMIRAYAKKLRFESPKDDAKIAEMVAIAAKVLNIVKTIGKKGVDEDGFVALVEKRLGVRIDRDLVDSFSKRHP